MDIIETDISYLYDMDLRPLMRKELVELKTKLYKTPRWRCIKRYRLHEKIYKLVGDMDLLDHVLLDM